MKITIEALMALRREKLYECRKYLNDYIKNINSVSELRKLIEKLESVENDLDEISKLIVLEESKK